MARELSQEALLDFLCQAGGRVANAALLSHFRGFLRDPDASPSEHQRRRELFKGFVNSVAAVRQDPDGTRYVVLKRRFRDLLGEERLQRPSDPPAAAAPAGGAAPGSPRGARRGEPPQQPRRRRREKKPEEEPAGAATAVADAGCNGLPASRAREAAGRGGGRRGSSGYKAREPAAALEVAQAGARCSAETRGRPCWECLQNGQGGHPGEPPTGAFPDPVTAREKPARARPAQDERRTPRQQPENAPAEPARVPSASSSPPTALEAAGGSASPPAFPSCPNSPVELLEMLTPGVQSYSTLQQQQQRTREWVARHPQIPEARGQGPIRAWSVLPDDFPGLPSELGFCISEPNPALKDSTLSSHSLVPLTPESFPGNSPVTVFRSIRCQLSLQDLDDFVDQESHGSEESSSGPKESPGGSEEGLQVALGTTDWRKLRSPVGGLAPQEDSPCKSPQQDFSYRGMGHTSQQVLTGANGLTDHPQEPLPLPVPKFRRSLRRSFQAGRAKFSSSDDEHFEEDLKRSRRPPRSRKPSKAGAVYSPRVDAALTLKPADVRAALAGGGRPHNSWPRGGEEPSALVPHRPSQHKSSLVPLDAREHEWIVRLASGSWIQVLALFWEEPQLALHKDFLTGYTALHWIAKHGDPMALEALVSGAQKAGIVLDVNVKSSCGYTPLHLAVIHGHQGVIKLLVQRLASQVNVRDHSGKKPWQYLTSNTSGEIWQLLGAPRGKPIFPVFPLVRSSSPTRKAKSRDIPRHVTRKTSLAALLKNQHNKWKLANQYEKFPIPREREEYSD
ncbi:Ankyrin repeat domain-containing protein SOWAHB [Galemys pyrenaicus]|uniref:Ankyrin repeat domain-containing protein SOWAHB n=1 Tax=Galemys pyrenaicus TaxID=202257 RepID=A0A8J6A4C6_GALPY|nr:Ankyrin repeat domain-containing protein SOWAHB [Galemys pyrenaicus]